MMIRDIFWVVVGIIAYTLVLDIMDRFSVSVEDNLSIFKYIVKETNQYVQNYWVTRIAKQPVNYLFCHIQIMESLSIRVYATYWLVHKIVITSLMFWKDWPHLTQVQTGIIICMIVSFGLFVVFDIDFDVMFIDFHPQKMMFFIVEFVFSIALIIGTQFLTEYHYNDHLSINIYNYVFFSNLSYTMILLCFHCIGMIVFDLYVNDYSSEIRNMTEMKNIMGQLQNNITEMTNFLPHVHYNVKGNWNEQIRNDTDRLNQVQKSLDDTVMHIKFMLVMFHLATMFFLLSTYFTGPANYVATQYDGEKPKPDYQETFISDADIQDYETRREQAIANAAAQANAGPPVVGNDGAEPVQPVPIVVPPKKTYLWKLEPYHCITCIKITVFSTLAHMILFVVTILLSPYAWRFYIIRASFFTFALKIYIHNNVIPVSKQDVCHMDPNRLQICMSPEGRIALGFLCFSQIIMAVYFYYYY